VTKFSVFLPVRNGWPYVQACVESILAQTYPHFELIVLDNQSTDNTVPWIDGLADPRIRLLRSTEPLSIVDSWARVKTVEKQEFMTMIGHDDLFDHGFLAAIKALIDANPNAALYQTGGRLINAEGQTIRSCQPVAAYENPAQYLQSRFTFKRDMFGTGFVMRSADYDRVGGIPPFERLFFADDALWLSLMRASGKSADPSDRFSVRIHPKSESASLPTAWSSMLLALDQFSTFLHGYVEGDPEAGKATKLYGPAFMLGYHRNVYIFALVEACIAGRKVDSAVVERIEASLAKSAPAMARALRRSPKVATIEALNAGPLRSAVPYLWNAYYRFRTRST
jgi:glycosyltransferase involved in cell wall biosynthesis